MSYLSQFGYINNLKKYLAFTLYDNVKDELVNYFKQILRFDDCKSNYFNKFLDGYLVYNTEYSFILCSINTILLYNSERQKTIVNNKVITASDIASYSFCPVSYAIQKSYDIVPSPKTEIGTTFHEQTRLIKKYVLQPDGYKKEKESNEFIDRGNEHFFADINGSKLIYYGHSKDERKRFFRKNDFVCQPDYIFQNSVGDYFVVEEKFRSEGGTENDSMFFKNHKLQLAAYMYGIEEKDIPKIEYGYLVYWMYAIQEGTPIVISCFVNRVNKRDDLRNELRTTFNRIIELNTQKTIAFESTNLNVNKCVKCSVAGICGHKLALFNELQLPYHSGNYNKLYDVKIPVTLSRYKNAIELYLSDKYPCQICGKWYKSSELMTKYIRPVSGYYGYKFAEFIFANEKDVNSNQVVKTDSFKIIYDGIDLEGNEDAIADVISWRNLIFEVEKVCSNCCKLNEIKTRDDRLM